MITESDLVFVNLVDLIMKEISGNFWTGNQNRERQIALSAPTSAVQGFEYLFHWEKERQRGEIWNNSRYFIRHTGKNHIVKLESREQGAFDFQYNSEELRYRQPIGKKFSISKSVNL